jgi:metal-responsive CopG/Arc/MetJ family transcriptional regulator
MMSTIEITITLETELLAQVDQLIARHVYIDRNQAIRSAIRAKLKRLSRLERECAKLNPLEEQALAEEAMTYHL